jgi:hypothetical protein
MVFNATFNNILSYIVAVSFIGGRNQRPVALKLLVGFKHYKKIDKWKSKFCIGH